MSSFLFFFLLIKRAAIIKNIGTNIAAIYVYDSGFNSFCDILINLEVIDDVIEEVKDVVIVEVGVEVVGVEVVGVEVIVEVGVEVVGVEIIVELVVNMGIKEGIV